MDAAFQTVPLSALHESPLNRKHFNATKLEELTESVRTRGVITPLLVRPRPSADGYDIAAGHRRFRAATAAGLQQVPCIVRSMTEVEFLETLTTENLQREDVHELEEAEGYALLMQTAGYDVPTIASKVGKSPSYVYQRLKLAELTDGAKEAFLAETITAGHAILLARLQPEQQTEALAWATAQQRGQETASVRALNQHIHEDILLDLTKAPFDPNDGSLVPKAGACGVCPFRAGNQQVLFPDVKKGDTCTAPSCYQAKVSAHLERIAETVQQETGTKPVRISLATDAHYGEKKLKGVLYRGHYPQAYRLIDAEGCPHAAQAVVFHRDRFCDDRIKLGAVVTICREPKCRKGDPEARRRATIERPAPKPKTPAERRKERDAFDADQVGRLTLENLNKQIVEHATVVGHDVVNVACRDLLRIVALGLVRENWDDDIDAIAKRRGWVADAPARRGAGDPIEKRFAEAIAQADGATILGLCVELAIARSAAFSPHYQPIDDIEKALELKAVAKLFRIDVAGAKRAAAAKVKNDRASWNLEEMKRDTLAKAKKKTPGKDAKASGKTKATPATSRKRKSTAETPPPPVDVDESDAAAREAHDAAVDDDPACETCGCVEKRACEGGCGWDTDYMDVGRYVCTTPICGQQAALRDKRLAKKNGRTYSGPASVRDLHTSATAG